MSKLSTNKNSTDISPHEGYEFSQKHLLGLSDYSAQDIQYVLDQAVSFREILNRPVPKVPTLRDKTIVNLFYENSTRTRLSFELAQRRMGADVVNFSAGTSSTKKGESLKDTIRNISSMKIDMVVVRHESPGVAHFLTQCVDAAILNAGDGAHEHPTQALLDLFTIQQVQGSIKGAKIAIIGDITHSRVVRSNIIGLKKLGAEVPRKDRFGFHPAYVHPSSHFDTTWQRVATRQSAFGIGVGSNR